LVAISQADAALNEDLLKMDDESKQSTVRKSRSGSPNHQRRAVRIEQ